MYSSIWSQKTNDEGKEIIITNFVHLTLCNYTQHFSCWEIMGVTFCCCLLPPTDRLIADWLSSVYPHGSCWILPGYANGSPLPRTSTATKMDSDIFVWLSFWFFVFRRRASEHAERPCQALLSRTVQCNTKCSSLAKPLRSFPLQCFLLTSSTKSQSHLS